MRAYMRVHFVHASVCVYSCHKIIYIISVFNIDSFDKLINALRFTK